MNSSAPVLLNVNPHETRLIQSELRNASPLLIKIPEQTTRSSMRWDLQIHPKVGVVVSDEPGGVVFVLAGTVVGGVVVVEGVLDFADVGRFHEGVVHAFG